MRNSDCELILTDTKNNDLILIRWDSVGFKVNESNFREVLSLVINEWIENNEDVKKLIERIDSDTGRRFLTIYEIYGNLYHPQLKNCLYRYNIINLSIDIFSLQDADKNWFAEFAV